MNENTNYIKYFVKNILNNFEIVLQNEIISIQIVQL